MLRRARPLPAGCRERACGQSRAPKPSPREYRCRCGAPAAPESDPRCAWDLSDLTERLTFPRHLTRCEVPFRVARHGSGIEVGLLVADRTAHRWQAMTVGAALDRRLVEPTLFALARVVAGWMAVHAARVRQHFSELGEHRS